MVADRSPLRVDWRTPIARSGNLEFPRRDGDIGVNAGTIASQCLGAGLLDGVWLDLVPVILGGGVPYFEPLPVLLDGPAIVEGERVTHLRCTIRKGA